MSDQWIEDPALSSIDPQKLKLLQGLVDQGAMKDQNELMNFFMTLNSGGQMQNLHFSKEEIQLIIRVIKKDKNPKEMARLEKIIQLMNVIKR